MKLRNTWKLSAVLLVIAVATIFGLTFGYAGRLSTTPSGDPTISTILRDNAGLGHHNLSAFILKDGDVRFGGLGSNEHTEFEIASLTKTFNGELLDQAVERGDLTYETTVADILGERAHGTEVADVTLEELATHTSGLPRLGKFTPRGFIGNILGLNPYVGQDLEHTLNSALDATLTDRGEYAYSNLGHALLGQLLAIKADTPYDQLVRRDIFEPLGMENSYVALPGTVGPDAPRGLWGLGQPVQAWEQDGTAPAGGIRSTPADMAAYAQAIVDKQKPNKAWVEEDDYFWHNGVTFGFTGELRIYPEHNAAVYVTGDTGADVGPLAQALQKELEAAL